MRTKYIFDLKTILNMNFNWHNITIPHTTQLGILTSLTFFFLTLLTAAFFVLVFPSAPPLPLPIPVPLLTPLPSPVPRTLLPTPLVVSDLRFFPLFFFSALCRLLLSDFSLSVEPTGFGLYDDARTLATRSLSTMAFAPRPSTGACPFPFPRGSIAIASFLEWGCGWYMVWYGMVCGWYVWVCLFVLFIEYDWSLRHLGSNGLLAYSFRARDTCMFNWSFGVVINIMIPPNDVQRRVLLVAGLHRMPVCSSGGMFTHRWWVILSFLPVFEGNFVLSGIQKVTVASHGILCDTISSTSISDLSTNCSMIDDDVVCEW